jgi:hypothetical protein
MLLTQEIQASYYNYYLAKDYKKSNTEHGGLKNNPFAGDEDDSPGSPAIRRQSILKKRNTNSLGDEEKK